MKGEKFIIANELADQIADTCIPNVIAQRLARFFMYRRTATIASCR